METNKNYILNLSNADEVSKGVEKRISYTGVRFLSEEQARQVGFYDRMSKLVCLLNVVYSAANRVYGQINQMLTDFGMKKHAIKKTCTDFEVSYERFLKFWQVEYEFTAEMQEDMNRDTDDLYHLMMKYGRLPEVWNFGDPQETPAPVDTVISVDAGSRWLNMHRTILSCDSIEEPVEEWCVTMFKMPEGSQAIVYRGMDRADAKMVAKRMSAEDPANYYTASVMTTIKEKRVEIVPMNAYSNNKDVGSLKKVFKDGK